MSEAFIDYHNFIFAADQHVALYLQRARKPVLAVAITLYSRDKPASRLHDNGHWDSDH